MLTALDHLTIDVDDMAAAAADLSAVLGREPRPEAAAGADPTATVRRLQLENISVLLRPKVPPPGGTEAVSDVGLAFSASDLPAAAHRLARRGLPADMANGESYLIAPGRTHGVPIEIVSHRPSADAAAGCDIAGLDHVVIRTPDPERAVALYGGRLGLDLRLDRSNERFGTRLLFFVCGDLVVEISHDLKQGVGSGPDKIWGFAWRANDVEAAHKRMQSAGVTVSELRDGRRPGTRVFTVKDKTCGVPTLVIGGEGLVRS